MFLFPPVADFLIKKDSILMQISMTQVVDHMVLAVIDLDDTSNNV
jgi:hypothetical protein